MKAVNLMIITAATLTIFGWTTACQTKASSKKEVITEREVKTVTNIPTPEVAKKVDTEPIDLSKVEMVSYCELIENSAKYDHQIVRVRAIYFTSFEQTYLYDETCKADKPPTAREKVPAETWAEWDRSLVTKEDSDEAKLNHRLNEFGRKDVTLIGKFNSTNEQNPTNAPNLFGHMNCCRFQFQIMRLEKIVTEKD